MYVRIAHIDCMETGKPTAKENKIMAHAAIIRGKLVLVSDGGSITGLGIRGFRAAIKQIEASCRPLKDSTAAMLEVYKRGVEIWDAQ